MEALSNIFILNSPRWPVRRRLRKYIGIILPDEHSLNISISFQFLFGRSTLLEKILVLQAWNTLAVKKILKNLICRHIY